MFFEFDINKSMLEIEGLTLTEDKILYQFPFDLATIDKVKEIGMLWSKPKKLWHMPRNLMNEHLFRMQFGDGEQDVTEQVRGNILEAIGHYNPHPKLMVHQLADVKIAVAKDRHLFANDTGTGKTVLGIEIIKVKDVKTLIVCPLSIINVAWFEDLDDFRPELTKVNLWKAKRRQLRFYLRELERHQVCIVNFEGFKSQIDFLKNAGFGLVIIDESSKIKSPKSAITKTLTNFCDNVKCVYLLTGTPAPNHDMEYFSQVRIVDPFVFGKSFYRHRNKYFFNPGYGFKWFPQSDMRQDFLTRLSTAMTVIKKEDVLDLPERTFNLREVILSTNERKAYKEMAQNLVAEIEDEEITAYNAAVKIMKLRQVTAGFIFNEEGTPLEIGTSKLTELLSLLEEIGDHQVLIWTQFQYEARMILKALAPDQPSLKRGIKVLPKITCGLCNGTVSQDMKDAQVRLFKDGKFQYMVAHPRTLGHGVTLTNANYAIYNSLSYSSEEEKQSQDRIYRKGQHNACTYYYLLAEASIDKVIYGVLRGKVKMEAAVLDYIKGVHKAKRVWGDL